MIRSELIMRIAIRKKNLTIRTVEQSVNLLLEMIADALTKGDRVEIRRFGSMTLNYRPPKKWRSPITGKEFEVPAKYIPHFIPAKEMRERVNSANPNQS